MHDLLALGKLSLAQQPFSGFMGVEFESAIPGDVVLSLPIKAEYKQNYGAVHGGVISYMADLGLAYAAASQIGDCVTSELKVNYIRPAIGEVIVARAKSIHASSRQVVCECKIFCRSGVGSDAQEILVAIALGTINRLMEKPEK
jgi:uncharacterized protein (TIGR00369 family)